MRTFMKDPSMEMYARIDASLQAKLYTVLLNILPDSDSSDDSDHGLQTTVWRLLARTQPAGRVMACLENNSIAMQTVLSEIFGGLRHHLEQAVAQESFNCYSKWLLREIAGHRAGPQSQGPLNAARCLGKFWNDNAEQKKMRYFLIGLLCDLGEEVLAPLAEETDRLVVGASYFAIGKLFQLGLPLSGEEWSWCGQCLISPLPGREHIPLLELRDVDCDKMAALALYCEAGERTASSDEPFMESGFQRDALEYVLSVLQQWDDWYGRQSAESWNTPFQECANAWYSRAKVLRVGLSKLMAILGDEQLPEDVSQQVCSIAEKALGDFSRADNWHMVAHAEHREASWKDIEEMKDAARALIKKSTHGRQSYRPASSM